MKKSPEKLFLIVFFMTVTNVVFAVPVPPPGLPIDGGLGYLVISGLIYGALKLRNKK